MADERITVVNLGSQHVSGAIFLQRSDGGLVLEQYHRADMLGTDELQASDQTGMALNEVVGALKVRGNSSRLVISGHPIFIRFVKLPPLDSEQVDQIVEFEAQQQVPFPINEVVWDYQLMGIPDDPEVEVLLAAIKADELDEIAATVSGSGIKITGAEVAPVELFNAFRFNYSDIEGTTLLIDIGARTTNLIFVESGKAFIRTIKIGGSDISRAIAKEFDVSFQDAEQRKIIDGFVALGGPYADHEDPVIAGISKVIRNSLTRLHSEVMRTTNFYRSQQGGKSPDLALLSGASVSLPFIREFFAEKLNIPIDYFNGLRNISLGKRLAQEEMSERAHTIGELVGAALSAGERAPLQIALAPATVRAEHEWRKRKPYLLVSAFCVASLLAGLGFWYGKAATLAAAKSADLETAAAELEDHSKVLKDLKGKLEQIEKKKEPYVATAFARAYWTAVFNDLSNRMDSDLMWITTLDPLSQGVPVMGAIEVGSEGGAAGQPAAQPGERKMIDALKISGLYRENSRGPDVVVDYLEELKKSPYFDLEGKTSNELLPTLNYGPSGSQYAWDWEMVLPLPENARIPFTK